MKVSVWPDGQLNDPGPGGFTTMFGCARPLCTGTFTGPVEAGAVTVSLFPADGFLPPLLMHWYVAVAEAAEHVAGADETFPRHETSPLQTSCPWLFTLNETLLKFAAANAVAAPNASSPVTTRMTMRCFFIAFALSNRTVAFGVRAGGSPAAPSCASLAQRIRSSRQGHVRPKR